MYRTSYNIGDINININNSKTINIYNKLENFREKNKLLTNNIDYHIEYIENLQVSNIENIYIDEEFVIKKIDEVEYKYYKYKDVFYALGYEDVNNSSFKVLIDNEKRDFIQYDSQLLEHLSLEKMFINFDAFILHSSFIKYKNKGILFTAPSGTGKSTQADLWNEYKAADIINGDRTLIRRIDNKWRSYGIPFCGSSPHCKNDSVDLGAIVILRQGPENVITRCDKATAIKKILSESTVNYWNGDFVNKIVDLLTDLVSKVDVYILSCRKDQGAVELLSKTLEEDGVINE